MISEELEAPATRSINVYALDTAIDENSNVIHSISCEKSSSSDSSDSSSTSSESETSDSESSSSSDIKESSSGDGSVCGSDSKQDERVSCLGSDDSVADKDYVPNLD